MRAVRVIPDNQRGVIFRLGRFEKVVGPGLVCPIPLIDMLKRVDLDHHVSGWRAMSPEQIAAQVKKVALELPNAFID